MIRARADLHIHTVLSPCASLDMSPARIVEEALEKKLQVIGITDHNSTLQCVTVQKIAKEKGIFVMSGAEINTKEEIHCLSYFPDQEKLSAFQKYIEMHQPKIPNRDRKFGYQVLVDENDQILEFIDHLLWTALDTGIEEIEKEVTSLDGVFIPAHIDRLSNGILAQLGFIPPALRYDALEITAKVTGQEARINYKIRPDAVLIKSSDAHTPDQIGAGVTCLELNDLTFNEVRLALRNENGRNCLIG